MPGTIVCGTCGYDYAEWKGSFYPPELPRDEFLAYYAAHFGAIEVDNTFYRMPTDSQLRGMLKKSGGKILFAVKAPRIFTHEVSAAWRLDVPHFMDALLPLRNAGVLSAVLFQFPQSFHYIPDNRIYLANLLAAFPDIPAVVEFRHREWFTDRVYAGLTKRNCGICMCDMPQLKALPEMAAVVTGERGYIRFHGRNSLNWYGKSEHNGRDRYRYFYSMKELSDLVLLVQKVAAQTKLVHVFFNNHPEGAAAANAGTLQELLGKNQQFAR
ncbi:MAG: DUF72 domain-containing protein [Treponema sp.]|jgi:uncharacterized protein YecE (DUF72 family)|nr:DUF72 domain-containing protein [Treponema sp.]